MERETNEAVERETNEAVMRETNEAVVRETNEVVVRETNEAVVREINEAVVRETNEAVVRETNEAVVTDQRWLERRNSVALNLDTFIIRSAFIRRFPSPHLPKITVIKQRPDPLCPHSNRYYISTISSDRRNNQFPPSPPLFYYTVVGRVTHHICHLFPHPLCR